MVIADADGRPVARLVSAAPPATGPGENPRDKVLGMSAGQVRMADDFDAPPTEAELEEWGL